MSSRAHRRLRRREQRSKQQAAHQAIKEDVQPQEAAKRSRLVWSVIVVLAAFATALSLHHVSRAAVSATSPVLVPVAKQIVVSAETLPTCVVAQEGDVNAKWLRATRMKVEGDEIILTLCDDATGERSTLTSPKGTTLPRKEDGQGGDLVLARLSTVPEHMDLEHFAFSTRAIETVQKGQQVVSRDQQTGKTEIKTVASTFKHDAYELVQLELADAQTGAAMGELRGTPEHPFFTPEGMVPMGKLEAGSKVVTREGATLVVKSAKRESHPEGVAVYNFKVEDDHTYFVGEANGGVWVHNANCGIPNISPDQARQIQAFASKYNSEVTVVGSRANGTGALSDFDYVLGNERLRHKAEWLLPRGPRSLPNKGIDVLPGPVDPARPNVPFRPGG